MQNKNVILPKTNLVMGSFKHEFILSSNFFLKAKLIHKSYYLIVLFFAKSENRIDTPPPFLIDLETPFETKTHR